MKRKMNKEELRQMVINSVKENDLHEIFSDESIQEVMTSIIKDYKIEKMKKQQEENEVIPEHQDTRIPYNSVNNNFPYEEPEAKGEAPVELQNNVDAVIGKEAGAEATEMPSDPVMYQPELPVELQGKEPAEFFVYDYNDLSVGGENLSHKSFHRMDDPNMMSSMVDEWKNNGKTKAKVYVVKYEEIGEVDFNYVTGQSSFMEKGKEPHVPAPVETYHENPYAAQSAGEVDEISTETDLTKTIESSVDLEATIEKTLMNLLSRGLKQAELEGAIMESLKKIQGEEKEISIDDFPASMKELFEMKKINTPKEVLEKINESTYASNDGSVKGVSFDGNVYFFPKNPVSHNKCYIIS